MPADSPGSVRPAVAIDRVNSARPDEPLYYHLSGRRLHDSGRIEATAEPILASSHALRQWLNANGLRLAISYEQHLRNGPSVGQLIVTACPARGPISSEVLMESVKVFIQIEKFHRSPWRKETRELTN
jgi:hypothetical protein